MGRVQVLPSEDGPLHLLPRGSLISLVFDSKIFVARCQIFVWWKEEREKGVGREERGETV